MVSVNPTAGGGGGGGAGADLPQQQHHQPALGMALPAFGSLTTAAASAASADAAGGGGGVNGSSSAEDPSKKVRKPYTITKSRESWTEQEHDKFLEALQLFDRDWKKIEAFVGSKTVIQIRSHAQKYFLKVQKNGTSEHVPPPRPKRKAAHPYPQKASKNALLLSQATVPFQASSCLLESGYALRTESLSVLRNSTTGATVASWPHSSVPPLSASNVIKDEVGLGASMAVNNCCCSSTESPSRTWPTSEATEQGNHVPLHRVMPDFSQVYNFIGSVFDPNTSGHLQKLKEMDPIDVETVLLLMRNLSVNLASPDFEDHRKLLSSCDIGTEEVKCGDDANDTIQDNVTSSAPFVVKGE